MTLAPERDRPASSVIYPGGARRTFTPLKMWACIGACCLGMWAFTWTVWFADGKATPTPTGLTEVPWWMVASIRFFEVGGLLSTVLFIYHFLVKPWRRERRITHDGLLLLAFMSLYFQDPLLNYFAPVYTYNAAVTNLGNWGMAFPGWLTPRGNFMPEPLLLAFPMYVYILFTWLLLSNMLMRRAQNRWPRLGPVGLAFGVFVGIVVFDFVIEAWIFCPAGLWTYAGSIKWLTINYGKYYQYPLTEGIFTGLVCTAWACLRYFRDDRGLTFAERGIDKLKGSPKAKTSLQLLALVGVCNVMLYVCYNLPMGLVSMHADPWPKDVLKRSYFTNGMCGPGTTYACAGPDVPLARPHSAHVSPTGELIPASEHR